MKHERDERWAYVVLAVLAVAYILYRLYASDGGALPAIDIPRVRLGELARGLPYLIAPLIAILTGVYQRRKAKALRQEWERRVRTEGFVREEEDVEVMSRCYEAATTSMEHVTVRDHALVLFLLATGLRIGEALALRWRDLDLEKRTVHVWNGKGGKERLALMDARAAEVMARLRRTGQGRPRTPVAHVPGIGEWGDRRRVAFGEDDPVFCGARPLKRMPSDSACYVARKLTRRYVGKAYTPHCLRHTFCTRFLRHGKTLQDLETLMELAGHSDLKTTQGYMDLDGRIRDERFERITEAHWSAAEEAEDRDDADQGAVTSGEEVDPLTGDEPPSLSNGVS